MLSAAYQNGVGVSPNASTWMRIESRSVW